MANSSAIDQNSPRVKVLHKTAKMRMRRNEKEEKEERREVRRMKSVKNEE